MLVSSAKRWKSSTLEHYGYHLHISKRTKALKRNSVTLHVEFGLHLSLQCRQGQVDSYQVNRKKNSFVCNLPDTVVFQFFKQDVMVNGIKGLLLVGLLVQLVRALHRYLRRQGFESRTNLIFFFSVFLFATAKVASITAMIFFHMILHPAVLIYDFHLFMTSVLKALHRSIKIRQE